MMVEVQEVPIETTTNRHEMEIQRIIDAAPSRKSQIDRFREAARELETDDDEARFDNALRQIVHSKLQKPIPSDSDSRKLRPPKKQ